MLHAVPKSFGPFFALRLLLGELFQPMLRVICSCSSDTCRCTGELCRADFDFDRFNVLHKEGAGEWSASDRYCALNKPLPGSPNLLVLSHGV